MRSLLTYNIDHAFKPLRLLRQTPKSYHLVFELLNSTLVIASCCRSNKGSSSTSESAPSCQRTSNNLETSSGDWPRNTLQSKEQNTTTSCKNVTCKSMMSRSSLKLYFKIPKAFSITLRHLDRRLLYNRLKISFLIRFLFQKIVFLK